MAEADELVIEQDAAEALAGHCEWLLGQIEHHIREAKRLELADGFGGDGAGSLPSADQLRDKFRLKAVGGANSAQQTLQEHQRVVTQMRDAFREAGRRYAEADQSSRDRLAAIPG